MTITEKTGKTRAERKAAARARFAAMDAERHRVEWWHSAQFWFLNQEPVLSEANLIICSPNFSPSFRAAMNTWLAGGRWMDAYRAMQSRHEIFQARVERIHELIGAGKLRQNVSDAAAETELEGWPERALAPRFLSRLADFERKAQAAFNL